MDNRIYPDNCSFNRPYDNQTILHRKPFDYTKWQENLFEDMTVEELAKKAGEYVKNNIQKGSRKERTVVVRETGGQ
jgi:hypothetical protein